MGALGERKKSSTRQIPIVKTFLEDKVETQKALKTRKDILMKYYFDSMSESEPSEAEKNRKLSIYQACSLNTNNKKSGDFDDFD